MGLLNRYKKHSVMRRVVETQLYEFVMDEIAQGVKQKGIWGQAMVGCDGDATKAEAAYIRLRVQSLKDFIKLGNIIENENLRAIQETFLSVTDGVIEQNDLTAQKLSDEEDKRRRQAGEVAKQEAAKKAQLAQYKKNVARNNLQGKTNPFLIIGLFVLLVLCLVIMGGGFSSDQRPCASSTSYCGPD